MTVLRGHRWQCLVGDVLTRLQDLLAGSVHVVVTSPPYWGLRAYSTAPQVWGGDPACAHDWGPPLLRALLSGGTGAASAKQVTSQGTQGAVQRPSAHTTCRTCGAWRGELGAEPVHDCLAWARGEAPCAACFVCHIRRIGAALWRVLRDDGNWILNLGDSYAGSGKGPTGHNGIGDQGARQGFTDPGVVLPPGLKAKDLAGVPHRCAFALQSDGWYLREDIVWQKANGMPESVQDRATRSHEYLFHLTKRPDYYWDPVAIAEPGAEPDRQRADTIGGAAGHLVRHSVGSVIGASATRNARSVWTFSTQPNPSQHFASFPPALPERVIRATTSARGCCATCGAPWERALGWTCPACGARRAANSKPCCLTAARWLDGRVSRETWRSDAHVAGQAPRKPVAVGASKQAAQGWRPTCGCYADQYRDLPRARTARKRRHQDLANRWWPRARRRPGGDDWPTQPAVVLDPFAGSGTTLAVAVALGREAVGIELNPTYAALVADRMATGATVLRRARPVPAAQRSLFDEEAPDA